MGVGVGIGIGGCTDTVPPPRFDATDIVWQGSLLDDPESFAVYIETGNCLGAPISEYAIPSLVIVTKDRLDCGDVTEEALACTIWNEKRSATVYICEKCLNDGRLRHEFTHYFTQCGNECHGNIDFATCSPEYIAVEGPGLSF